MQPAVNARLGKAIGTVQAASVSFLVGTVVLVAIAAFVNGGLGHDRHAGGAPWWAFVGGLLGAAYVTVALVAVRTLGAAGLTAAVITGQLAISVLIDRFGLLGVAKQPVHRATHRRARPARRRRGARRASLSLPRQPQGDLHGKARLSYREARAPSRASRSASPSRRTPCSIAGSDRLP